MECEKECCEQAVKRYKEELAEEEALREKKEACRYEGRMGLMYSLAGILGNAVLINEGIPPVLTLNYGFTVLFAAGILFLGINALLNYRRLKRELQGSDDQGGGHGIG